MVDVCLRKKMSLCNVFVFVRDGNKMLFVEFFVGVYCLV